MKKIIALVLALCLVLGLTACGSSDKPAASGASGNSEYDLKVGVVHIGDPADKSGYSYAHQLGIDQMKETLEAEGKKIDVYQQVNVVDEDESAVETAIKNCIAEGCQIIFTTSYGYMDVTRSMAEQYPDIIFSHGTGYMSNETNFNNYFGRIYQARYLSGIAAGMKTKSNKIGYVAAYGTELAETCSGISAFAMGVESVNPNAKVYVKTLSKWYDAENETAYAQALVDQGCDVIAQHCDTSNPQTVAKSSGVWGIGYNSDMTAEVGASTLTSTIWNWGVYYTAACRAALNAFANGSYDKTKWNEFGNYYGGYKEGLVGITPLSSDAAEGTSDCIALAEEKLKNSDWDVFSGVALSFTKDGDKWICNTTDRALTIHTKTTDANGNVTEEKDVEIAAGNNKVDDSVITGSMSWFYSNVELAN